ncbi:unnamed protein product, partial [Mesorhabditis spiculigera]
MNVQLWFYDLFSGLHYLQIGHAAVHQDVKPQNLLISDDFVLKIGDFGTLKILDKACRYPSMLVGTPNYVAPEYLNAREVILTAEDLFKADIYGAGLVLWEMITRREVSSASEARDFTLGQHVPGPLQTVLSRCVEKTFSTRATCKEMYEKISEFANIPRNQFRPQSNSTKNYLVDPITQWAFENMQAPAGACSWMDGGEYVPPENVADNCVEFEEFMKKVKASPNFDAWTIKKRLLGPLDNYVKFPGIPLDDVKDIIFDDKNPGKIREAVVEATLPHLSEVSCMEQRDFLEDVEAEKKNYLENGGDALKTESVQLSWYLQRRNLSPHLNYVMALHGFDYELQNTVMFFAFDVMAFRKLERIGGKIRTCSTRKKSNRLTFKTYCAL